MEDKNQNGLHDPKEEKYLNTNQNPHKHADPVFDPHRRAGLTHGFGIFLIILGVWWLLRDIGLVPRVSLGAILALLGGIWLLKSAKRK